MERERKGEMNRCRDRGGGGGSKREEEGWRMEVDEQMEREVEVRGGGLQNEPWPSSSPQMLRSLTFLPPPPLVAWVALGDYPRQTGTQHHNPTKTFVCRYLVRSEEHTSELQSR